MTFAENMTAPLKATTTTNEKNPSKVATNTNERSK